MDMSPIARGLCDKGKAMLQKDEYRSAADFFSLAYSEEDNDTHANAKIKHLLGVAYGCAGAFHVAEAAFRDALSLASDAYKQKVQKDYDLLHKSIIENRLDEAKFREGIDLKAL